jgi:hypothetical protein
MKRFLAVAALGLALPSAAFAQVAAGSVPNPFDRPAGAPVPSARPATQAPAAPAPAEVTLSPTPANAASEDTLRSVIASLQAGTPDYSLMTTDLATQMRTREATILPLIKGFGTIQSFDFAGSRNEADVFVVNFASAETEWFIGMDDDGKVAALLFRPAQEVAPAATTTPSPSAAASPPAQ